MSTHKATAHLVSHLVTVYDRPGNSQRSYYTVQCDECLVVLNSGHHYEDESKHYALKLADEHNSTTHLDRSGDVAPRQES
jgi:hypothetical protein